jgi:hypothetical protein
MMVIKKAGAILTVTCLYINQKTTSFSDKKKKKKDVEPRVTNAFKKVKLSLELEDEERVE